MAAFEAIGVKEKFHDGMGVIGDMLEFRGHGVSNELWQGSTKRFPNWHNKPSRTYSEVSVVWLEAFELENLFV